MASAISAQPSDVLERPIDSSDVLIRRLEAWRQAVIVVASYASNVFSTQQGTTSGLEKQRRAVAEPPQFGGLSVQGGQMGTTVDSPVAQMFVTLSSEIEGQIGESERFAQSIKQSIIPGLETLAADLDRQLKHVRSQFSKGSKEIEKLRESTQRNIEYLGRTVATSGAPQPGKAEVKYDPYLWHRRVKSAAQEQISRENTQSENFLAIQQTFAALEKHIIEVLQRSIGSLAQLQGQFSESAHGSAVTVNHAFAKVVPSDEWARFVESNEQFLTPESGYQRDPQNVTFANHNDPSTQPLIEGSLYRKGTYLKSSKPGYYVLTRAGYLHQYESADHAQDPHPVLSLYIPESEISGLPARGSGDLSFKIISKDAGKVIATRHKYSFKTSSYEELAAWYAAISKVSGTSGIPGDFGNISSDSESLSTPRTASGTAPAAGAAAGGAAASHRRDVSGISSISAHTADDDGELSPSYLSRDIPRTNLAAEAGNVSPSYNFSSGEGEAIAGGALGAAAGVTAAFGAESENKNTSPLERDVSNSNFKNFDYTDQQELFGHQAQPLEDNRYAATAAANQSPPQREFSERADGLDAYKSTLDPASPKYAELGQDHTEPEANFPENKSTAVDAVAATGFELPSEKRVSSTYSESYRSQSRGNATGALYDQYDVTREQPYEGGAAAAGKPEVKNTEGTFDHLASEAPSAQTEHLDSNKVDPTRAVSGSSNGHSIPHYQISPNKRASRLDDTTETFGGVPVLSSPIDTGAEFSTPRADFESEVPSEEFNVNKSTPYGGGEYEGPDKVFEPSTGLGMQPTSLGTHELSKGYGNDPSANPGDYIATGGSPDNFETDLTKAGPTDVKPTSRLASENLASEVGGASDTLENSQAHTVAATGAFPGSGGQSPVLANEPEVSAGAEGGKDAANYGEYDKFGGKSTDSATREQKATATTSDVGGSGDKLFYATDPRQFVGSSAYERTDQGNQEVTGALPKSDSTYDTSYVTQNAEDDVRNQTAAAKELHGASTSAYGHKVSESKASKDLSDVAGAAHAPEDASKDLSGLAGAAHVPEDASKNLSGFAGTTSAPENMAEGNTNGGLPEGNVAGQKDSRAESGKGITGGATGTEAAAGMTGGSAEAVSGAQSTSKPPIGTDREELKGSASSGSGPKGKKGDINKYAKKLTGKNVDQLAKELKTDPKSVIEELEKRPADLLTKLGEDPSKALKLLESKGNVSGWKKVTKGIAKAFK